MYQTDEKEKKNYHSQERIQRKSRSKSASFQRPPSKPSPVEEIWPRSDVAKFTPHGRPSVVARVRLHNA